ncbi:MAG: alpha/beta fold hydrolase [Acidimicrobiia bacterium]
MPYAEFDDVRLHIRQRGSGPVAVFIHGFPFDSTMWIEQLAALEGLRRCIAVDLRGFGRSSPVSGDPLTMESHAEDLAAVLDIVSEERADIVGLSMGGYVALAFAESYPDRMRSLALIDTRAGADSPEGKAGRDAMARRVVSEGRAAFAESMQATLLGPNASLNARARFRTMVEGCPYETLIGALAGMRDRPDRTSTLGSVAVPAMVMVGDQDAVTPPEQAAEMAAAIPGATLVTIADAGHLTPVEQPQAVSTALAEFYRRI